MSTVSDTNICSCWPFLQYVIADHMCGSVNILLCIAGWSQISFESNISWTSLMEEGFDAEGFKISISAEGLAPLISPL